jgi:hypothetical protein
MYNQTRQNLEKFDNEHEFERLASDVLNSMGYGNVEPMAPLGGADGGSDILFSSGKSNGIAFVTLRKDIRQKFKEDLDKFKQNAEEISLFSIVDISPTMKSDFTNEALKKGATLVVFDLERLRSLFDSTLKDLRRRYLGIDDDLTIQIKDKLNKIIIFKNTQIIEYNTHSQLELMFVNKLPQMVFHLLMSYEFNLVKEVPKIGNNLKDFLVQYDAFIGDLQKNEDLLITKIGKYERSRIRESWKIQYKYSILRFCGNPLQTIQEQGNFLNYGITWESAEAVYSNLIQDGSLEKMIQPIISKYDEMCEICLRLIE